MASFSLIVNQPYQSASNVLRGAFRFILGADPRLLRLEELWRFQGEDLYLYDSFNCQNLKFAVKASDDEIENDGPFLFRVDGDYYVPDPNVTRGCMDDIIEAFNDNYSDCYIFKKTNTGYSYYRVIKS